MVTLGVRRRKRRRGPPCFYDMNIFTSDLSLPDCSSIVSIAFQLGFSGVVLNHVVRKSSFAPSRIRAPDVSQLLPSSQVARSAKFHRQILRGSWEVAEGKDQQREEKQEGKPKEKGTSGDTTKLAEETLNDDGGAISPSFRQFSRLTLVVDTAIQASVLNESNPIIRSYDLVSIQPTSQQAFDQACTNLEVDIISFDLSHRLPFRFKTSNIKAAVKRGIYFEISLCGAFSDVKARRELFANAQILQASSRGKNIIVSSGARQGTDLRGPNDMANMATLFGLSREAAKASVSKNCEDAILRGLARKRTYRSAITVTKSPRWIDHEDCLFNVPDVWDPFSNARLEDEEEMNKVHSGHNELFEQLQVYDGSKDIGKIELMAAAKLRKHNNKRNHGKSKDPFKSRQAKRRKMIA